MVEPLSCPQADALQRVLAGKYRQPEAAALEEHLAHCPRCLATARTLRVDDRLVEAAREGAAVAEILRTPVDEALLARLDRLGPLTTRAGAGSRDDTPLRPLLQTPASPPPEAPCDFLAPPEGPDEIGRLGGYRVFKVLGAGGMGVVLEAEDPRLRRRVALKAMHPPLAASATARQRFLREARSLAAVRHDHVVPVYEVGEHSGIPFLAMPLLRGQSLEYRLRREGRLPVDEVVRIGREAAEGLAAAHAGGSVHRDVKPANIWLESRAERGGGDGRSDPPDFPPYRVLLLDFGLARAGKDRDNLTASGAPVGTPAYMAPEQARGEPVDARGDLFSLGVILYRMATGRLPFKARDVSTPLPTLAGEPVASPRQIEPTLPPPLAELILQMLAPDPSARPASAAEVADRLRALERQQATPPPVAPAPPARPPAAPAAARPPAGRAWRRRGAVAVLVLLGLAALGYFFGGVVYRLATDKGQVVIEVDDPDTTVTLKEGGAVIQDGKGRREVTLAAGTHDLEVTVRDAAGEVRFFTTTFQLRRGGKETVNVRRELARAGSRAPGGRDEAERAAALWLLSQGGKGVILVGETKADLTRAQELPAGTFRVVNVFLGPDWRAGDAGLDRLADLPDLRSLKLQGPWVSDASLPRLKGLKSLQRLDLVATGVTDAGLTHLSALANLTHLMLIQTPVTDAGLVHLQALRNLHDLELGGTRVTEAGMDHLAALPNLTGLLNLNNSKVTDAWLGRLKSLSRLTALSLANNPVTDAGLASLTALPKLQYLNLSHTRVGDAGLVHVKPLRDLYELRLAWTRVSDAGLANLQGLQALHSLDLRGTRVTDAGLEALRALTALRELDLIGTDVTTAGVAALQKALPSCHILFEPAAGK
jgi:tRNA A-37 threonylcarbamoyl transferase component Bud32